ncbi:MAG: Ig-like domain-containing protein [Kiritimatiellae bacterium]|nr:Ig-like domain-containing protein [Kiritimatiellia bacterium]
MNKRLVIVAVFVLAGIAFLFVRNQAAKPFAALEQADHLTEKASAVPAIALDKKTDTSPNGGKVNPLCAPGSTVYLTQTQQEYKLGERGHNTPDVKDAKKNGANAKVTLRVVDSRGNPVPDADVEVAFFHRGSFPISGKTDEDGFFAAEHMSGADVHFYTSKKGYYNTQRNYWFYREGKPCAENGRWVPWNPTLEVVLKEKRNPIPLPVQRVTCFFPINTPVGFDCEKAQLVAPYGIGVCSDLIATVTGYYVAPTNYSFHMELTSNIGGYVRYKMDSYSQMWSVYEAPAFEEFHQTLNVSVTYKYDRLSEDTRFKDDDYLVFCSRVLKGEGGEIKNINYGKIRNGLKFNIESTKTNMAAMSLSYQFNTTPNDRNLEWPDKSP